MKEIFPLYFQRRILCFYAIRFILISELSLSPFPTNKEIQHEIF